MKKPFVTFQTIAYNAEKYIEQTIQSILNQSEPNFEYYIRNNGSTDRTSEIIKKYAKRDKRIVVVENKINGMFDNGESMPFGDRMFPTENGEYISIVDSDDYIHKDFLKILYQSASENNADIVTCGCDMFNDGSNEIFAQRIPPRVIIDNDNRINAEDFRQIYGSLRAIWGKLIKTEFHEKNLKYYIENVYPKPVNGGDTSLVLVLMKLSSKSVFIDKSLYYWRKKQVGLYSANYVEIERIKDGEILFDIAVELLNGISLINNDTMLFLYKVHYGHINDLIELCLHSSSMTLNEKLNFLEQITRDNLFNIYALNNNEIINKMLNENIIKDNMDIQIFLDSYLARLMLISFNSASLSSSRLVLLLTVIFSEKNSYLWGGSFLNQEYNDSFKWYSNLINTYNLNRQRKTINNKFLFRTLVNSDVEEGRFDEIKARALEAIDRGEYENAIKYLSDILNCRPLDREAIYLMIYATFMIKDFNNLILSMLLGELFWNDDNEMVTLIDSLKNMQKEGKL